MQHLPTLPHNDPPQAVSEGHGCIAFDQGNDTNSVKITSLVGYSWGWLLLDRNRFQVPSYY